MASMWSNRTWHYLKIAGVEIPDERLVERGNVMPFPRPAQTLSRRMVQCREAGRNPDYRGLKGSAERCLRRSDEDEWVDRQTCDRVLITRGDHRPTDIRANDGVKDRLKGILSPYTGLVHKKNASRPCMVTLDNFHRYSRHDDPITSREGRSDFTQYCRTDMRCGHSDK
ncbi:hypothetical protein Bbelb_173040 [Branchiostoma belcheri]|nr:hypothetical protein Bbelb_173040 [Branchiostoma belcheri]